MLCNFTMKYIQINRDYQGGEWSIVPGKDQELKFQVRERLNKGGDI